MAKESPILALFRTSNRMEDLALFTRHVAGAMRARVPLPDILRAFLHESEAGKFRNAIATMADRVESGVELSVAMEDFPRDFPAAYRRLVRLGEQGRTLGGIMNQTADTLEEGLKTYESFRRAAIYPLLIAVLLFLDLCFLNIAVAPKFMDIYTQLGVQVTGPLGSPHFMQRVMMGFGLVLLSGIVFALSAVMGLRVKGFGPGRLLLQLPLVGTVVRRAETARFANHLSLLLGNRLPLSESLALLVDSSENAYVRAAIEDFHRRYESGEPLGDLIASQPLFPPAMATMVAAAEDQGGLAETLRHLGRFYSERTSHGLTVLREIFEPILLLLIGVFVVLAMLAIFGPLFQLPRMIN